MRRHLGFSLSILLLMLATGISYQLGGERGWYSRKARLAFKGLTTAFAAVLALYAYFETQQTYALVMAGGIILCAAADVLLDLRFLSGTACFAAGHLAYIASFWMRSRPQAPSLVLFIALAAVSTAVALLVRKKVEFKVLPFYLYSLVISLMAASALALPPWVFIGAVLFVVSDGIIARRLIKPGRPPWDRACIYLYYCAQYTLAATLLL